MKLEMGLAIAICLLGLAPARLTQAESSWPSTAPSDEATVLTARAADLTRDLEYEGAQILLNHVLERYPNCWRARFLAAQIQFFKRDLVAARHAFEELLNLPGHSLDQEDGQVIRYQILLTYLVEADMTGVDRIVQQLQNDSGSKAWHFAQAAVASQRGNASEARKWIQAAREKFPEATLKPYTQPFAETGWEKELAGL